MLASKLRTESVSRFLKNAQIIKDFGEIFVRVLFFTYTHYAPVNIIAPYLKSLQANMRKLLPASQKK